MVYSAQLKRAEGLAMWLNTVCHSVFRHLQRYAWSDASALQQVRDLQDEIQGRRVHADIAIVPKSDGPTRKFGNLFEAANPEIYLGHLVFLD